MARKLEVSAEFVGDIPWQLREPMFDRGEIHICWMCGLPYVRKRDARQANAELVAAPVMRDARYGGRPVYFSDVVVHTESTFSAFDDLRGATWAYNEPASHSGYNIVRYHLATRGMDGQYFGRIVESGSHQESLLMILERSIDEAAIDSTVLEMVSTSNRSLSAQLRTIAVLGPSPAPPCLVHRSVPRDIRRSLREQFLSMQKDPEGRRILEDAGVLQFVEVSDCDYNPIREMDWVARAIEW